MEAFEPSSCENTSVVKNGQNGRLIGRLVGDGDQTVTNSLVGVVFADQTD